VELSLYITYYTIVFMHITMLKWLCLCIMEKDVSIGGNILNCFTLTTELFYTITYLVSLTFVYCFL